MTFTAELEPFSDLKITLSGDRRYAYNFSEQYDVTNGMYNSRSPYSFGNFSISTVLIKTSFSRSDESFSAPFEDLKSNRLVIADRLAQNFYGTNAYPRYGDTANPIPASTDPNFAIYNANKGYPIGFGKNNQAVLLPSFLAAYSGSSASGVSLDAFRNIPIPNWTIKYSGLMRFKFFKDKFGR